MISGFSKMSKWDLPCLSAYHTHSSQVPTYTHKGNSSFNICILYTYWSYTNSKRSQDWSKHTVKNHNTTVAPTVYLIAHSWIPVLEGTLNIHFPLTSTGCIKTPFHSEEETVLVTLPHNKHKSLVEHTAIIKDDQSTWALQGSLTEPTQSSCKATATQIAKRQDSATFRSEI